MSRSNGRPQPTAGARLFERPNYRRRRAVGVGLAPDGKSPGLAYRG